jgi:hypothetical protein
VTVAGFGCSMAASNISAGTLATRTVCLRWCSEMCAVSAAPVLDGASAKRWVPSLLLRSPPHPSNCFSSSPMRRTAVIATMRMIPIV